jgi:uncharacterized protein (DUF302 family)
LLTFHLQAQLVAQAGKLTNVKKPATVLELLLRTGEDHEIYLETPKSVDHAVADLQTAVQRHKFGVLHIHNLQEKLKKKGVNFPNACQILEICNPQRAKDVLTEDMDLNMALPCRVSVYSEGGKTKIGMMKPPAMLKALSDSPALARVAQDVEETIIEMIAGAK